MPELIARKVRVGAFDAVIGAWLVTGETEFQTTSAGNSPGPHGDIELHRDSERVEARTEIGDRAGNLDLDHMVRIIESLYVLHACHSPCMAGWPKVDLRINSVSFKAWPVRMATTLASRSILWVS